MLIPLPDEGACSWYVPRETRLLIWTLQLAYRD
jgi:hypothetical protein